jgi:predicted DNA-binding protein with PD1-like motif
VFALNDEVASGLLAFAREVNLRAAHFAAIGAFSDVVLGFFDLDRKEYLRNPLREQVEVLSPIGNMAGFKGQPKVHDHVVVGKRDGTAYGGH